MSGNKLQADPARIQALMELFIEDNKIAIPSTSPMIPGAIVSLIEDGSFGIIIEVERFGEHYKYGYAECTLELDGMDNQVIEGLAGSWWYEDSHFEKVCAPTPQSLAILNWFYCEQDEPDDEDGPEEDEEDDEFEEDYEDDPDEEFTDAENVPEDEEG